MTDTPTPTRAERAKRDARVLQMYIAGATYRDIGERLGMSHTNVDKVIRREMAKAAKRRDLLADQALATFVERTEAIFKAHFPNALRGDYKASVICDRILARQARLYGLTEGAGAGTSMGPDDDEDTEPPLRGDGDEAKEDVTRLDEWRRRSSTGT